MKAKRILAMAGVIILVGLYASTLVFALMNNEHSMRLFMASIYATIIIPVMIYGYMALYKIAKKNDGVDDNEA